MIFWVLVSTQPGTPLPLIINREHLCFQIQPCFSWLWQGLGDCLEADTHRKKKFHWRLFVLQCCVNFCCTFPSLAPQGTGQSTCAMQ